MFLGKIKVIFCNLDDYFMSHFFLNLISLLSMIRIITFFFIVFKVYNIALDDEFSLSNILLRIRDGLGVTEVTK